jgi:hypothetical protein
MRDIRRESREGEERHLGLVVEEKKRNVVTDNHFIVVKIQVTGEAKPPPL